MSTNRAVKERILLERRIARAIVKDAIKAGFTITVFDGEEYTLKRSADQNKIMNALMSTDEDIIYLHQDNQKAKSFVHFIYGNSGYDVMHDWSTDLDDKNVLTTAHAIADKAMERTY